MPIPIIIDCDPGTDDALALLLALGSPEFSVLAITVAGGNVGLELTLPNALAVTALAGSKVPVHAGADRPLLGRFANAPRIHGADGLAGVVLPPGGSAAPGLAADVIRGILRQAVEPVTLVGIGPATNLALALTTEPALAARVGQIVLMSGAWGEGNVDSGRRVQRLERSRGAGDPVRRRPPAGVRDVGPDGSGTCDARPDRRMARFGQGALPARRL